MRSRFLILLALAAVASGLRADPLAQDDPAQRLLKDTADPAAPIDPAQAADSANKSVEKARNQKESMERLPALLRNEAPAAGQPAAGGQTPMPAADGKAALREATQPARKRQTRLGRTRTHHP
jgi:hypothetical protein